MKSSYKFMVEASTYNRKSLGIKVFFVSSTKKARVLEDYDSRCTFYLND